MRNRGPNIPSRGLILSFPHETPLCIARKQTVVVPKCLIWTHNRTPPFPPGPYGPRVWYVWSQKTMGSTLGARSLKQGQIGQGTLMCMGTAQPRRTRFPKKGDLLVPTFSQVPQIQRSVSHIRASVETKMYTPAEEQSNGLLA